MRGIVKRDVVRVVTPGVMLDEESLDPRAPSYVAAVVGDARGGYGLAFLDVIDGRLPRHRGGDAPRRWSRRSAGSRRASWCSGATTTARRWSSWCGPAHATVPRATVAPGDDAAELARALGPAVAGGPRRRGRRAPAAAAAARCCATRARRSRASSCRSRALDVYRRTDTLVIDEQARRHLELTESLLDRRRAGSLIEVLDESRTAMGGRLLRRWLLFPSVDVAAHPPPPRRRRAAGGARTRRATPPAACWATSRDIERLVGRARLGVATPRDLAVLGPLAGAAARAGARRCADADAGELGGSLAGDESLLLRWATTWAPSSRRELARVLRADAPAVTKDGGFVNAGRLARAGRAARRSPRAAATASPPSRRASASAPASRR